jgi:lipid-A-disaccharide synthase
VPRSLYFVAGEASGDEHGAALMAALRDARSDLAFFGRGGPKMAALANAQFQNWIGEAAVLGLWEVVKRYGYFRREFAATLREITATKPDAVVLIDYPGFNLRLAPALQKRGIASKIIYYISPQVWAWNRARIPRMARSLGLRTIFVGHPMLQNLAGRRVADSRERGLVGLFPGSRLREVRAIFPVIRDAATKLLQRDSGLRFEVAAASEMLAAECQRMLGKDKLAQHVTITTGEATSLMQRAAAGIVASGTATLEAAYFRLPFVLVYKVSWATYLAARLVVNVKHLGMPNVLAGREIVREFIQHHAEPNVIAAAVVDLLEDANVRNRLIHDFDEIISKLGEIEATRTAARAVLEEIGVAPG